MKVSLMSELKNKMKIWVEKHENYNLSFYLFDLENIGI